MGLFAGQAVVLFEEDRLQHCQVKFRSKRVQDRAPFGLISEKIGISGNG